MIGTIKSEFRKLWSVRSTYAIIFFALVITAFAAGFIEGFRADSQSLQNTTLLATESTSSIVFVGLILGFAGLLLMGNEYRFTSIMYTLTASNRRYKVLLAKFLVITLFSVATGLLVLFFAPACTIVGAHLAGKHIGPQTFDVWSIVQHGLFTNWGYAMYAFGLVLILRNQIGAIVTFLLIPLILENILQPLLKTNIKYLPFNAVQSVSAPTTLGNHTTSGSAMLTVVVYVLALLLIGAILFGRRDAN